MSRAGRMRVLLGLAAADALGAATEFQSSAQIARRFPKGIKTYASGSPFSFHPGEATDDTQMTIATLCGLTSGSRSVAEVLRHYINWLAHGPPDVGGLTRSALSLARRGHQSSAGMRVWQDGGVQNAGNGGLMRVAGVFLAGLTGTELSETAIAVTALTHADPRCIVSSLFMVKLLEQLEHMGTSFPESVRLAWETTEQTVERIVPTLQAHACFDGVILTPSVYGHLLQLAVPQVGDRIAAGLNGDTVSQTGYVLDTLQAALALHHGASTWLEVAEGAALAGDDSDTVGCVAGAIAGARGFDVPSSLITALRVGATWGDWQRSWTADHFESLL